MAKCRSCGTDIRWIKTPAGNLMPCDVKSIQYWPRNDGKQKIVTQSGVLVSAHLEPPAPSLLALQNEQPETGYIPHWATCPYAKNHRRERK